MEINFAECAKIDRLKIKFSLKNCLNAAGQYLGEGFALFYQSITIFGHVMSF